MCQSCTDEHHKTLGYLKDANITSGQGLWTFIASIFLGGWAVLIAGCYSDKGCGAFCCLFLLMWVANFALGAGYIWGIIWAWNAYKIGQGEHDSYTKQ